MFNKTLEPPKFVKHIKPIEGLKDINLPSVHHGYYGHIARQPNTDYHVRFLEYKQKQEADELAFSASEKARLNADKFTIKLDKHTVKKNFQRQIKDRVNAKLEEYEESVEKRRAKLRELLCKDEIEFYYETVDKAQRGKENKMEEMRQRVEELESAKEAERQELVKQKRIQQYSLRCLELRPVLSKQMLMDTKCSQLLQIKENEARRESEKEIEAMWHDMMIKSCEAKMERETQELLKRTRNQKEMMGIWGKQIKGKRLLDEEVKAVAEEDRLEMEKLREQLRREEIEALDKKRRKRDEFAKELLEQLEIQEEFQLQRKREELALNQAFYKLTQDEIKREKEQMQDLSKQAKKEAELYRNYLKELNEQREEEERQLNELLKEHKLALEAKQEEAQCKIKRANQKLKQEVMQGRAEQLELKRQEAENQLRLKEAENELLKMTWEANERQEAEQVRLRFENSQNYRCELQQQINHNRILKQREQDELKRLLEAGKLEEEKYKKFINDLMDGKIGAKFERHPFRQLIEREQNKC